MYDGTVYRLRPERRARTFHERQEPLRRGGSRVDPVASWVLPQAGRAGRLDVTARARRRGARALRDRRGRRHPDALEGGPRRQRKPRHRSLRRQTLGGARVLRRVSRRGGDSARERHYGRQRRCHPPQPPLQYGGRGRGRAAHERHRRGGAHVLGAEKVQRGERRGQRCRRR
jgi:hypothetical protein